jgi:tRNA dimethylallyltransferase
MLAGGWQDEVRHLMEHVPSDAPAWNATGYRAIRALVQGELSTEEAVQTVVIQTRQYAKRQRTWFRHQLAGDDVTRIDVRAPNAESELHTWWNGATA